MPGVHGENKHATELTTCIGIYHHNFTVHRHITNIKSLGTQWFHYNTCMCTLCRYLVIINMFVIFTSPVILNSCRIAHAQDWRYKEVFPQQQYYSSTPPMTPPVIGPKLLPSELLSTLTFWFIELILCTYCPQPGVTSGLLLLLLNATSYILSTLSIIIYPLIYNYISLNFVLTPVRAVLGQLARDVLVAQSPQTRLSREDSGHRPQWKPVLRD